MSKDYTKEHIQTLEGMEAIRKRPGMYIGSIGLDGLHQITLEIISNSIDALKNKNNPKIRINIFSNNAEVIISLEDNASGIKPKNLKKIFEPYFSTKEEGTGIGLYLSKMIIEESFSGKILVENQKEGVLFSLFIEKTF